MTPFSVNRLLDVSRSSHLAVVFVLAALAITGFSIVSHYGVAWDDFHNRQFGRVALQTVEKSVNKGLDASRRLSREEHGTLLEMVLLVIENGVVSLGADLSLRQKYLLRHACIFAIWLLGLIGFYFLNLKIFENRWLALLGVLLLALHPRLFAHAFFNSYDIGFLVASVWCVWSLMAFLESPSYRGALVHGILSALAIDIRIVGIQFVGITLLLVLIQQVRMTRARRFTASTVGHMLVYLTTTVSVVVGLWPYLWAAPLERFVEAIQSVGQIKWTGITIYLGEPYANGLVPWHYNFVWIGITTPLPHLALTFIGLLLVPIVRFAKFLDSPAQSYGFSTACLWAGLPLLAPVLLHSVLMDGWRHHFFVYPALVIVMLFAVRTVSELCERSRPGATHVFFWAVLVLPLSNSIYAVIAAHPYQNVYFNGLIEDREKLAERYDLDYWGVSYRGALEYILSHDDRDTIRIAGLNRPVQYNTFILPEEQRRRIEIVRDLATADYFVSNFRDQRSSYRIDKEVYSISVLGVKIMTVRRLPK